MFFITHIVRNIRTASASQLTSCVEATNVFSAVRAAGGNSTFSVYNGTDFHPYGFEKNRRTIEVFANQAFDLGIVGRRISPEEYFADFLAS